ncbi:MAG: hypothetical protein JXQ76_12310 [Campylobacterales bacterium]|nr:hypothetical protein [Campylobacterales bacterium]
MVAVRLDSLLEEQLNHYIKEHDMTKTQVIKDALQSFFDTHSSTKKTPYELGKDLFGLDGSGDGTLSTMHQKHYKAKLREKYRSHR